MIYPCPKPPKTERKPSRLSRRNKSDGQQVEICRDRESWEERREEVGSDADYLCQHCGDPAPLHDVEIGREEGVMPYIIRAGQAAHRIARKMGGAFRNDEASNLRWLCFQCHHLETVGKLVIA